MNTRTASSSKKQSFLTDTDEIYCSWQILCAPSDGPGVPAGASWWMEPHPHGPPSPLLSSFCIVMNQETTGWNKHIKKRKLAVWFEIDKTKARGGEKTWPGSGDSGSEQPAPFFCRLVAFSFTSRGWECFFHCRCQQHQRLTQQRNPVKGVVLNTDYLCWHGPSASFSATHMCMTAAQ